MYAPTPKGNPTPTLVPRPKLSIASSDRDFCINSADWNSFLASYDFLCSSQARFCKWKFQAAICFQGNPTLESEMWITWKVIVRKTYFCEKISCVFQKYFNFVPKLESRNVDHMKRNCSWDVFLWKNSDAHRNFMSFWKMFQLCTHARITKCGSHEKWLFLRHIFVKKFWRTSEFHEFFKIISALYPRQNHEMWITVKSYCSDITVSWVFQIISTLCAC